MAVFKYKAVKSSGNIVESILYADSEEEARAKIIEMGYTLEKLEKHDAPDRRIYERMEKEVDITFSLFRGGKTDTAATFEGITRNISAGGLCFTTKTNVHPGMIIDLVLQLKDEDIFVCLARIIRSQRCVNSEGYDVAVCFLDLPNEERQRLNKYIYNREA